MGPLRKGWKSTSTEFPTQQQKCFKTYSFGNSSLSEVLVPKKTWFGPGVSGFKQASQGMLITTILIIILESLEITK